MTNERLIRYWERLAVRDYLQERRGQVKDLDECRTFITLYVEMMENAYLDWKERFLHERGRDWRVE